MAKTRLQLQGELVKGGGEKVYRNVFDVFAKTWRNEGIRGVQRGLTPAVSFSHPYLLFIFWRNSACSMRTRYLSRPSLVVPCRSLVIDSSEWVSARYGHPQFLGHVNSLCCLSQGSTNRSVRPRISSLGWMQRNKIQSPPFSLARPAV